MTEKSLMKGGELFTRIKQIERDLAVIDGSSVSVRVVFENKESHNTFEVQLLKDKAEELRSNIVAYYKEELNKLQKQFALL